jgi:hypothetical protein
MLVIVDAAHPIDGGRVYHAGEITGGMLDG